MVRRSSPGVRSRARRALPRWIVLVAIVWLMSFAGSRAAHAKREFATDGRAFPGGPIEAEPPFIDLYTFEVGPVIFEKFGHAALCLRYHDPKNPTVCFNYGVTDFNAGARLIWGFLRTQQKFWVEPEWLGDMLRFYRSEDRTMWVQTLPVTGERARAIENRLWFDILDENKYYYYDHFLDNCTTRLRDIIDHHVGGKLRAGTQRSYGLTYRQIGQRGLAEFPPLLGVSDFVVGRDLDRTPTVWEAMSLPEVLRQAVEAQLEVPARSLYQRQGPPFPTTGSKGRLPMTLIAIGLALPLLLAQGLRRFQRVALWWTALPLTIWGLLIWTLAILSSIPGLRWNEALLLFTPTDLLIPLLKPRARMCYVRVRLALVLLASLLLAIGVFRQPLWVPLLTAFLPLAILVFDLPSGVSRRRSGDG
jgi:hypothetical protein